MTATKVDGSRRPTAVVVIAVLAVAAPWLAAAVLPAVAQPQTYHHFADQRAFFGIPNALNVLSNVPFLVVGALGLAAVRRMDARVAIPYTLLFVSALMTALGSAWYHASPSDATLLWDRLPIAAAFAGLVAGTLTDRAPFWSVRLTLALGAVAIATVQTWFLSGNLTPYIAMQASFFAVALYATARVPSTASHARGVYWAALLYALAVLCERFDATIDQWTDGLISGHPLKHVVAATALFCIVVMLNRRQNVQRAEFADPSLEKKARTVQ